MGPSKSSYAEFPVLETIEIKEISDIPEAVQKMTETYAVKSDAREFSYRLLLPRGEKLNTKAKRIGMTALRRSGWCATRSISIQMEWMR